MVNYFTAEELSCSCCGSYAMKPEFIGKLNAIREECGFPLPVTSGYRCTDHPIEKAKAAAGRPYGTHTRGVAADIAVSHDRAHELVRVAMKHGIQRIGLQQTGRGRFVHLDIDATAPAPRIWTY
ncbi:MAG: peptidase M15 [Epibacterium sp.]|nr:peptidase M15 [Epibacterium sp.]